MRLKEHFEWVRSSNLSDEEREKLFLVISQKIDSGNVSIWQKWSFYAKVVVYTIFFVFIFYSFYGVYTPVFDQNPYVAKAWDLGKIVELKGDFKIIREGEQIESLHLKNNDLLVLGEDSKIAFEIGSWVEGQIWWPARIRVLKAANDGYYVKIEQGKYVRLQTSMLSGAKLSIETPTSTILPLEGEVDVAVSTSEKAGEVIHNTGKGKVKIVSKQGVVHKPIVIASQEAVKIKRTNETKVEISSGSVVSTPEPEVAKIGSGYEMTPFNATRVGTGNSSTPTLDEETIENVKNILYPKFLSKDVKNLIVYYLQDSPYFQKVERKLVRKSLRVAKALNIEIDSKVILTRLEKWYTIELSEVVALLDQLVTKIEKYYPDFPKRELNNLKKTLMWVYILKNRGERGSLDKDVDIDFDEIFTILRVPSAYRAKLKFIY